MERRARVLRLDRWTYAQAQELLRENAAQGEFAYSWADPVDVLWSAMSRGLVDISLELREAREMWAAQQERED